MKFSILQSYLWCLIASWMVTVVWTAHMLDMISSNPNLSEFASYIQKNDKIKILLESFEVTVFAPTNDAWRRFGAGQIPSLNVLNYHITKTAYRSDRSNGALLSEAKGSLTVWVRKDHRGLFFANQALVIDPDKIGYSVGGDEQVLHIIDDVLLPLQLSGSVDIASMNPSAHRFIQDPKDYDIGYSTSEFYQKVREKNREMVFQGGDGYTFFIPVNGNDPYIWNEVDEKVIDGHIIPNKVYFSRVFPPEPQTTLGFTDMQKTLLIMKNESFPNKHYELFIRSQNIVSYPNLRKGSVIAKIVKADIPVKNGVVHLIENPLIVTRKTISDIIQQNSQLTQFSSALVQNDLDHLVRQLTEATVFVPSDFAFSLVPPLTLAAITNDETKVQQMLKLHIVRQIVTTDTIIQRRTEVVPTEDLGQSLHLSSPKLHALTVMGGGVTANITDPDVIATNGIVHIINRVLGISSFGTIYDKLSTDGSLNETFWLGKQRDFNSKFQDVGRRYTYFVPNNEAWDALEKRYPNDYNDLAGGTKHYNLQKILNRHLIVNKALSIQEMLGMEKIQMVEGVTTISRSGNKYFIHWDGEISEILSPNIETANGNIHIIRSVLYKRRDLTGQASELTIPSLITVLVSTLHFVFYYFI